jgi:hypothetical protein
MALPQTEGGGEGPKMCDVNIDAHMPNNQLQTADNGQSSSLEVGWRTKKPLLLKAIILRNFTIGRIFATV